jgi:hypothetical protein
MMTDPRTNAEALAGLFDTEMLLSDEFSRKKKKAKDPVDSLLPVAPLSPMDQAVEKYGMGGAMARNIGSILTAGLFDSVLMPEMTKENRAQYKSDLALYQKEKELGIMDPQVEDYAKLWDSVDPTRAAYIRASNSVKPSDGNDFTLGSGQTRYDAFNNVVAQGGDPFVKPTAAIQDAEAIARTRGIPLNSPFFGDLVSAVTEPSETRTDENGNTYTVNTVSEVLRRWDEQQNSQSPPQQRATAGTATSTPSNTPATTDTQDFNTLGPVLSGLNEKQAQLVTDAPDKLKFYERFGTNLSQLGEWDEENQRFVIHEDVKDLYGGWDANPLNPQNWNGFGDDGDNGGFGGDTELFMPQGNRDKKAVVEQLIESLAVDERGQLKGQGQITEGETAMLRSAVTRAAKRGMGDKAAEDEFTRLYLEYQRALKEQQGIVGRYWPDRSSNIEQNIIDLDD